MFIGFGGALSKTSASRLGLEFVILIVHLFSVSLAIGRCLQVLPHNEKYSVGQAFSDSEVSLLDM